MEPKNHGPLVLVHGAWHGGWCWREVADKLNLSEKTVKMHRSLILEKIGTHNVADAIRLAVEAGL